MPIQDQAGQPVDQGPRRVAERLRVTGPGVVVEAVKLAHDRSGDVIVRLKKYKDYIAHYHTGGNPGRHEIDETQELYYPAIVKGILDTGYDGYLGQEFIPTRDPLAGLKQAVELCDV
jgi:hydroxypyruvate isomerase